MQVVCHRQHVFACGVAVARAFPTYSLKTRDVTTRDVTVCFITPDDSSPLTEQDIKVLTSTAKCKFTLLWIPCHVEGRGGRGGGGGGGICKKRAENPDNCTAKTLVM